MSKCVIVCIAVLLGSCVRKTDRMVDSQADSQVHKLYAFLQNNTEGMMFGHQDDLSYGIGWTFADEPGASDVEKVCGDFPAVFGWDIGHIETGSPVNIDSVDFGEMRRNIRHAHEMGGINTVSWHPLNPVTGGNTWDVSVRTVEQILPGGAQDVKFEGWLQTIGQFFLSLKDSEGNAIPVIFRPYHEHTGSWFWWGHDMTSQGEYVQLWKYTVTYLRDTMGVHNLLYAYSTDKVKTAEEYLDKYPGDEWVDILGIDVYDFPHYGVDYEAVMPECLSVLAKLGKEKGKPYALTETGNLCVKPEKWWTESLLRLSEGYGLQWALVWINLEETQYYGPTPLNKSADDFLDFYQHPSTLFLNDIPQWQ